jgi:hypothetical protein
MADSREPASTEGLESPIPEGGNRPEAEAPLATESETLHVTDNTSGAQEVVAPGGHDDTPPTLDTSQMPASNGQLQPQAEAPEGAPSLTAEEQGQQEHVATTAPLGATTPASIEAPQPDASVRALTEADPDTSDVPPPDKPAGEPVMPDALRAENERLRAEVASLRTARTPRQEARRIRRGLVGVLVVLSCLGVLASTLTVWAHETLTNTDNWLAIVGPVGQNPQVINAVSAYAADQAVTLLQVQPRLEQALPPKAEFLAAPLTGVVHNFTQSTIAKLMHSQQFQQLWIATNRYVHDELLAALRGQSKNVIISNGTVTLNLIPVINQGLQAVQQQLAGLIPAGVKLPDLSHVQVPQQARQKLSQALGVQIPANFGQIVLFQSDQVAQAQQFLRLFDFLNIALPVITFLLIVATLWLSISRRRTAIQLGIGIVVTLIIAKLLINYAQQRIVDAIANQTAHGVVQETLQTLLGGLGAITTWLLILGVLVSVAAYLAGKPQWFATGYRQGRLGYARVRKEIDQRWPRDHGTPVPTA